MGTREQILATGRDLLVEDGLRAITTNAIAQRARVSKKTLYQHFPSKDELLEEIVVSFLNATTRPSIASWPRYALRANSGPKSRAA